MDPVGTRPVDELTLSELYSGQRGQGRKNFGCRDCHSFFILYTKEVRPKEN